MNYSLHDLMVGDVSLIATANCALARLWRLFLYNLGVKAPAWEVLLSNYINECKKHMDSDVAVNLKGNVSKGLAGSSITWERLCQGLSVFNFEVTEFTLVLTKRDTVKEIGLKLPVFYDEDPGKYLKLLWDRISIEYPHETGKGWTESYNAYIRKHEGVSDVPAYLKSSVKRGLNNETLTWNMFYRAMAIIGLDEIKMILYVKSRGLRKSETTELRLL